MTQYNHRIVSDGATKYSVYDRDNVGVEAFACCDTIPCPSEWTAEEAVEILKMPKKELDEIGDFYLCADKYDHISVLISDLISLKGLSKEEIQSLSEVRK